VLVSIVIPAKAWDSFLEGTLATVAAQDLPSGVDLETVVGLAGSPPRGFPPGVRVVRNPTGTIPDALNLAIAASTGQVIVRVDARCHLAPDHVTGVLSALKDPTVGCVGSAQLVLDRGLFGSAYAMAFNSPLLGPSKYRYSRRSSPADTAYLGAWRRDDLAELGGFDPRLLRNQDNELADRVRAAGKTVYYDADLVVGYYNARGLVAAMAHHRDFGQWRMIQRSHGQRGLARKHVLAVATVLSVAVAAVPAMSSRRGRAAVTALGAASYLIAAISSHWSASRLRQARRDIEGPEFHPVGVALAPGLAALINGAWSVGLAQGFLRQHPAPPKTPST
jgi:succinoglycan biosynthesis protein ExoA